MLDKKGRIFGKISIIDALVIVLVLVMAFGGYVTYQKIADNKVLTENKGLIKNNATDTLEVTMRVKAVRQMTVDAFSDGDEIFFDDTGKFLGKIDRIEVAPSRRLIYDKNGAPVFAEVPERFDVLLKVHVPGKRLENGFFTADNIRLTYGSEVKIKTVKIQTTPVLETITTLEGE